MKISIRDSSLRDYISMTVEESAFKAVTVSEATMLVDRSVSVGTLDSIVSAARSIPKLAEMITTLNKNGGVLQ